MNVMKRASYFRTMFLTDILADADMTVLEQVARGTRRGRALSSFVNTSFPVHSCLVPTTAVPVLESFREVTMP